MKLREGVDLEQYIKISADSISELRKVDVFRVISSLRSDNLDGVSRNDLATFIATKRSDLVAEVTEVMREEFPQDGWAAECVENTDESPRIERISGGRNRVLVLHTKDSDMTFVIPPDVSEHEWLAQESSRARSEAASLYERARQLTARARFADVAAGLSNAPEVEPEQNLLVPSPDM